MEGVAAFILVFLNFENIALVAMAGDETERDDMTARLDKSIMDLLGEVSRCEGCPGDLVIISDTGII